MHVDERTLRWFSSEGGPLLVLPESIMEEWQGVQEDIDKLSDYDRACQINEDVGYLTIGDSWALVFNSFGDERAWYSHNELQCFIRSVRMDDEAEAIESVSELGTTAFSDAVAHIEVSGRLAILDSAYSGTWVKQNKEYQVLEVRRGEYSITIGKWELDEFTTLILYRFKLDKPTPIV